MLCRQVQSHLDDFILNQLDKEINDQINNHLKECLDCQKQLEKNRQLIAALKSLPTPDPGDYYWQQMEDSILARTVGENRQESKLPEQVKIGPIGLMQRYLIPLAASIVLLFGSLLYSNSDQKSIRIDAQSADAVSSYIMAENNPEVSDRLNSQVFTTIVATAPGSLGRHLIIADIIGGSR